MISVIIPLYNKQETIRRTVESVLSQTYRNFEIIVVNDGSTDRSVDVVERIQSDKIRILHQENKGVSAARNRGILEARSNWIALLDGDDEWHVDFLNNVNRAVQEDPDCIIYCSGYARVSTSGLRASVLLRCVPSEKGRLSNYYKASFFSAPVVTSSSVCLNKQLLNKNGLDAPFPIGTKSGEDLDTWVRLALKGDFYFINKELVNVNVVNAGVSHISDRLSGEFDYLKWVMYNCSSNKKRIWLILYALKKQYKILRKKVIVKLPWLHKLK